MKNVMWRPLKSDQHRGDVGRRGHIWPIPLLRPVSLAQWYQPGGPIWSDPRKRSETLVSMNGTTCPPLPSPPPLFSLTYLWWCISGISCSLSEWSDWIDMFSLHNPFHAGEADLCSHTAFWRAFSLARVTVHVCMVFAQCIYRLQTCGGWGQSVRVRPFIIVTALCHHKKDVMNFT